MDYEVKKENIIKNINYVLNSNEFEGRAQEAFKDTLGKLKKNITNIEEELPEKDKIQVMQSYMEQAIKTTKPSKQSTPTEKKIFNENAKKLEEIQKNHLPTKKQKVTKALSTAAESIGAAAKKVTPKPVKKAVNKIKKKVTQR